MPLYPKYMTTEKQVGETPLVAIERLRESFRIPAGVPMAYAGRLDPMASGKLLVLIGNECKNQEQYHAYDKEYVVEVLLGARSDSGDVLGLIESNPVPKIERSDVQRIFSELHGKITLPYPHFSSRPVRGKPLHTWTLEGRLNEIEIPTYTSTIYKLSLNTIETRSKEKVLKMVLNKIETIPKVTDERKALGADFRRDDVRASWGDFEKTGDSILTILSFTCTASSGMYMRSLAELIGQKLGTYGLAYSIHRSKIGRFTPIFKNIGFWSRQF